MGLLENIINELVDNKVSLSGPFLQAKVLAYRSDNQILLAWANKELLGYSTLEVPTYRTYLGNVYGTYINGRAKFSDIALPISVLPDNLQEFYNKFKFSQGIEALESLLKEGENVAGTLSVNFTAEEISILEKRLKAEGNPYLQILSAYKETSLNTVKQTLSVIRSLLLDFMLEVEKMFGSQVDIKTLRENKQEIITIMNQTINNNGNGVIINTGNDTKIDAKIKVIKNDKTSLTDALREQKVSEEDVYSLTNVIDLESPIDNNTFGEKVQSWLSKMLTKSLNGTWEIGVATAGGILTEILKQYYGM